MGERLAAWGLGVMHAALLLLLFVALTYRVEAIGSILDNAGTLSGLAIGLWLGSLSVGAAWWTLRGADLKAPDGRRIAMRAMIAGGVTGALFVDGLFLTVLLVIGGFELPALLVAVFGGAVGFAGGSLVGALFTALDLLLLSLARSAAQDDAGA